MSDNVLSQLQSAYEAYQLNPNVAKQIVAATANGRQPPSIQGLAAAAALQAPQAPVQPPQGTVIQHLAAQQGIAGQIPSAIGLVPQAPAQPQMPPQGMAAGGLVSFMHGGDVRGFAAGTSELLRAQGIPDASGYFEAGDINDIKKALETQQDLKAALEEQRLEQVLRNASRYSPEMPEAITSQFREPSAYQLRGQGYTPEAPRLLLPAPEPKPSSMDVSKISSVKQPSLAERLAPYTAEPAKAPTSDKWTTGVADEIAALNAGDLGKLGKVTKAVGKVAKPLGLLSLAADPRLNALYELGVLPATMLAPKFGSTAHLRHELPKVAETTETTKKIKDYLADKMKAEGGEVRGYAMGDLVKLMQEKAVLPSGRELLDKIIGDSQEAPATPLSSLDKSVPEAPKLDYGFAPATKITPHIEKAAVHPEAKKTDSSFKKASIDTSSTALQDKSTTEQETPAATAETPEETIAYMQKLAGGPRQISPEMMSKLEKGVTGAKEDKWLGALMGLLGGTLSSSSPYFGQAVGEGGLKALSAYQQGAKEQGAAEQALMSAQLGQEDAQRASQQAAFEQYMKTQQAKMNAQAELAKAGIGAKARWDLLQENLAFKAAHPEIYNRADLQLPGLQMQMVKEVNDALDAAAKAKVAKGITEPLTPQEKQAIVAEIYSRNPYVPMPSSGIGGSGYGAFPQGMRIITQDGSAK